MTATSLSTQTRIHWGLESLNIASATFARCTFPVAVFGISAGNHICASRKRQPSGARVISFLDPIGLLRTNNTQRKGRYQIPPCNRSSDRVVQIWCLVQADPCGETHRLTIPKSTGRKDDENNTYLLRHLQRRHPLPHPFLQFSLPQRRPLA